MPKRARDGEKKDGFSSKKPRKDGGQSLGHMAKVSKVAVPATEIDFPRGGGSSLTPLEQKTIYAEAAMEVREEGIIKDSSTKSAKRVGHSLSATPKTANNKGKATATSNKLEDSDVLIEHLSYERMTSGQKILCQIIFIHPLTLIVSLPNQLTGHIPIKQISSVFTDLIENDQKEEDDAMDVDKEGSEACVKDEDDDMGELGRKLKGLPDMSEMFSVGQYLPAIVTDVRKAGQRASSAGEGLEFLSKIQDQNVKGCERIRLSISPDKVNAGISSHGVVPGSLISGMVKSVEDHGYVFDFGIHPLSGFLPEQEARKATLSRLTSSTSQSKRNGRLYKGQVLFARILSIAENGRVATVSLSSPDSSTALDEGSRISSLTPGALVSGSTTAIGPKGLVLDLCGSFRGTVELSHIRLPSGAKNLETAFKLGDTVKARILWDASTNSPTTFAVSLLPHILALEVPTAANGLYHANKSLRTDSRKSGPTKAPLHVVYPTGTILERIRVIRVVWECGLLCEVLNKRRESSGLFCFAPISNIPSTDLHTSGPYKPGTVHKARVMGVFHMDGLLRVTLKESDLEQRYFTLSDVQVGGVLEVAVKSLSASELVVSISDSLDGVVRPLHYADVHLKKPGDRFKDGKVMKARVLAVNTERRRITLTLKNSLLHTDLPLITSLRDARVGRLSHAVIKEIRPTVLIVTYFGNVWATIPLSEASEESLQSVEGIFAPGQVVRSCIISVDKSRHKLTASIRQASSSYISSRLDDLVIGTIVHGMVLEMGSDDIVVALEPSGVRALVPIQQLASTRGTSVTQLKDSVKIGDELDCLQITTKDVERSLAVASVVSPKLSSESNQDTQADIKTFTIGAIVSGEVIRHVDVWGSIVQVEPSGSVCGILHPTDTSDNYDVALSCESPYPPLHSAVRARVIGINMKRGQLFLSSRASRLDPSGAAKPRDPEINDLEHLKVGDEVRGFIKKILAYGLFVSIGRNLDAHVGYLELSDKRRKDWKSGFAMHQLVKGKIIKIDVAANKVEMSLRTKGAARSLSFNDFHAGDNVDGVVQRIEAYGIIIKLDNTDICGLCHKTELSDSKLGDFSKALSLFREGDKIRAHILSVNIEKKRITLGLKSSYFNSDDTPSPETPFNQNGDDGDTVGDRGIKPGESNGQPSDGDDIDDRSSESVEGQISPDIGHSEGQEINPILPPLQLQDGFKWGAPLSLNDDDETPSGSDDEDEDENSPGAKSRKKRPKGVQKDMTVEMHSKAPESTVDFERVLLGSPNSSFLWIQFMSFQLQLSEVEKAREVARRALKTINFREEQEKLNVWIAFLNLEISFGRDESLETVFVDACRYNDSEDMHLRLAAMLDEAQKHEKAEEIHNRAVKRFGKSSKVWTLFIEHYLKRGMVEEAQQLLPRGLQSLEKRDHLETIAKTAQLEYKVGEPERGKTIFEGIVDSYPKRLDLWTVYIDMEASQRNIDTIRSIFDRVLSLKLSSKKAKILFKKWLALEKNLGTLEGQETVKSRAIAWTQSTTES